MSSENLISTYLIKSIIKYIILSKNKINVMIKKYFLYRLKNI